MGTLNKLVQLESIVVHYSAVIIALNHGFEGDPGANATGYEPQRYYI